MSNKPRKSPPSGASRVAAAQSKRKSQTTTWLVFGVVLIVGVALLAAIIATNGSDDTTKAASPTEKASILQQVSSVPATTYDAVGVGTVTGAPVPANGEAIKVDGKPEVLYIGAEFCPYCAAERWAIATALARFGTFTNVGTTHSAGADVFPNTATLTFHGSSYTSKYIAFTPREVQSNKQSGGVYTTLDTLTPAQQATWSALSPNQSFPFVDFGGKYVVSGATYDPGTLQGKTATEIAGDLADPTSSVAKAAIGAANAMTAAVCDLTGNQPAAVCSSKGVTAAKAGLTGT